MVTVLSSPGTGLELQDVDKICLYKVRGLWILVPVSYLVGQLGGAVVPISNSCGYRLRL